mgnify:CR=1 FL=1|tara:strand:+ start:279 stop:983 length:705 start_codon:yes stop_codon:yes gene_type:complete
MIKDSVYISFLFISSKKFILSVLQSDNTKKIYEEEISNNNNSNKIEFDKLDIFLEKNIYKVERIIGSFIKDIIIIYESEDIFPIDVSMKNNNNGDFLNNSSLSRPLLEAREACLKSHKENKIIHMLIENFRVNNKNYSFLPENFKCEYYFLDIKFICISKEITKNLEICMKKFQISVYKILSGSYLETFFNESEKDPIIWAMYINNGYNKNEVSFHEKTIKKQGFFEKFFNFFN